MKKMLLGSVAVIALTGTVNAADLSPKIYTKAPVAVPAWTGFYLFGGAGYGMWSADQQVDPNLLPMDPLRTGGRGWFGTVGGGYDWQFNSNWVGGIFADAQFGSMKGTYDMSFPYSATAALKNNANYAAGARLGYLIAPNALSYVNAGYSHAEFSGSTLSSSILPPFSFSTARLNLDGWFVGGGVENSLDLFGISTPGLFMKTEYRLAEYGRKNIIVTDGPLAGPLGSFKPYVQTISTSLVYRFNANGMPSHVASAPVYTKAPAAAHNWTGFYLSGGGGYGLLTNDQSAPSFLGPLNARMGGRGYFGTVGGGYDWQFTPSWVGGVFADAQLGDIKASADLSTTGRTAWPKNDLSYAVGIRAGYLVAPNVLSYVNGGYSRAEFTKADFSPALTSFTLPKTTYDGWFVGGGVENDLNMFGIRAPGWFMKTEYRLAEYGRKSVTIVENGGGAPLLYSSKPYVQTISTSLVYRFNWSGAPLVAKY